MPFKTFVAGETLTSSDVNTYLAKQAVIVCTSGTRPGAPVEGMCIYETDTDRLLSYDGTTWTLPKNVAGGVLGYAQVTADQTGITSEVDLTGLSVPVTVGSNRRIRVTGQGIAGSTADQDGLLGRIKEGAMNLGRWIQADTSHPVNPFILSSGSVILTPSAGAHTYKLSLTRYRGTGSASLTANPEYPASILVEDIGGA